MNSSKAVYLINIKQKDNYTFNIDWSDGSVGEFRLSKLQQKCPCANCNDELTGKPTLDPNTIQANVRAINIKNIGRYALKIQFTSGCSAGIYDFNMLHKLGQQS